MTKRLKYTKDILTHMLNNNNPGGNPKPPNTANGNIGSSNGGGMGGTYNASGKRGGESAGGMSEGMGSLG